MVRRIIHTCVDIQGAMRNAEFWVGGITGGGKKLDSKQEVIDFLQSQLDLGRQVLPTCDCEEFDYQTGCPGEYVYGPDEQEAAKG